MLSQRWLCLVILTICAGSCCVRRADAWSWFEAKLEGDSPSFVYQVPDAADIAVLRPKGQRQQNCTNGLNSTAPSLTEREQLSKALAQRQCQYANLQHLKEENDWKNDLVLFMIPTGFRRALPRVVLSWLRNYVACMAVYFGVSGAWAYYVYWVFGYCLYGPGNMPSTSDVFEQAWVAVGSIPGYAVLPALTEAVVEAGWTRAYARIGNVGVWWHLANFAVYMLCVEFAVYWMHRLLHDIRVGYRWLHYIHHKYNKEGSLSPFAGLAFHPLDGIIQALPYCVLLLVLPMHFLTHELMLFMTGIWTTNIHDCLHARIVPIMGAGYHTIHHTTYQHNYGHYFIYMDRFFNTLEDPDEFSSKQKAL
ncbi:hypothetical protein WJX73_008596 [Symbiochloris irregularis]|uniref:Fatty acid hydroxylase domain-containing protein n=1 Tax=Symbiochloris irregularis TaxID=706552 RepID=A0AAW1P2F1_9CHLO